MRGKKARKNPPIPTPPAARGAKKNFDIFHCRSFLPKVIILYPSFFGDFATTFLTVFFPNFLPFSKKRLVFPQFTGELFLPGGFSKKILGGNINLGHRKTQKNGRLGNFFFFFTPPGFSCPTEDFLFSYNHIFFFPQYFWKPTWFLAPKRGFLYVAIKKKLFETQPFFYYFFLEAPIKVKQISLGGEKNKKCLKKKLFNRGGDLGFKI